MSYLFSITITLLSLLARRKGGSFHAKIWRSGESASARLVAVPTTVNRPMRRLTALGAWPTIAACPDLRHPQKGDPHEAPQDRSVQWLAWALGAGLWAGLTVTSLAIDINPQLRSPRDRLPNGDVVDAPWPSFDPDGSKLIAIAEAAASVWEAVLIDDRNYDTEIRYFYGFPDPERLGQTQIFGDIDINPFPASGNWFIDPTPLNHSEFTIHQKLYGNLTSDQQNDWFDGDPPARLEVGSGVSGIFNDSPIRNAVFGAVPWDKYDMFTIMLHEMGHKIGFTNLHTDYDILPELIGGIQDVELVVSFSNKRPARR